MRKNLLYNPAEMILRTAMEIQVRRKLRRLKGTPGAVLSRGVLGTMDLLTTVADNPLKGGPIEVIFDIGAHVGLWTLLAKSIFPHARIDAFEPIPSSQASFSVTTKDLANVHLHATALGSRPGHAEMTILGNQSDSSSMLSPSERGLGLTDAHASKKIRVPVVRLDDMVAQKKIPLPDFIKIDVQGFELEVFRGAEKCLKHARAVQCEVSFNEYYAGQAFFRDVVDFFDDRGFRLYRLADYSPDHPFNQPDAFFVKKDAF